MADASIGLELAAGAETWAPASETSALSEDALLAERLKAGDGRAYEILVDRFEHRIYNLVRRLLADPEDAADVVQEVFLKVFRSVGRFRAQSSLKTWIYRIAVNEAHNHRRWFGRRKGHEVGLESEAGEGTTFEQVLADTGQSPFDAAAGRETHERIETALASLNPRFRAVVVLCDVEGLTYQEIADILGASLGTVKSRLVRGREALKAALLESERRADSHGSPWKKTVVVEEVR